MNLLLDTCTFLWVISESPKLSATALDYFQDPANTCWLSGVSTWEIAASVSLRRLDFEDPIQTFIPHERRRHGIRPLKLLEKASLLADKLPMHHRDPFDRMLVCQAIAHGMTLLTPDEKIARYSVPVVW